VLLDGGSDKLLANLGYEKRRKIDDASFSKAGTNSIRVGSIGDSILLYTYLAPVFLTIIHRKMMSIGPARMILNF
jgi:hypothetical protein